MAFLAGGGSVHSQQWEMGQIMIKQDALRPTAFLMTTLALLAFLPPVYVVTQMTAVAFRGQFFFVQFAAVARSAVQFGMLAFEWELGVFVMIEACLFPTLFCVAGVTLLAVTPAVLVIVFMAAETVLFGFYLVYRVFVTGLTDNLLVFFS